MDKQTIISEIRTFLLQQEVVVFAYLFGSFAEGDVYRDIDIAIFTSSQIDLLDLGRMNTELESKTHHEIDLIELNDLPNKSPELAYQIVTHGLLLVERDSKIHTDYKKKAWLYYFDTSKLREMMDHSFNERLESNKIGQRNYE